MRVSQLKGGLWQYPPVLDIVAVMGRTAGRKARDSRPLKERVLSPDPERFGSSMAAAIYLLRGMKNLYKSGSFSCNLCGYEGRFYPYGNPPRKSAVCPVCHSRERHRLIAAWLSANSASMARSRVLHFAPEPLVANLLREQSATYTSADIAPGADLVLNIEAIDLPEKSVDLVVCSHVLEHVNDGNALREIHRILDTGGRVLLMFPIIEGWDKTYENSSHTSHADRSKYFGQYDHVRMFGRDVRERIRSAGFQLDEFTAEEPMVSRHGLLRGEKVFVATKA
jgi:SAM-dependent methyltransferase